MGRTIGGDLDDAFDFLFAASYSTYRTISKNAYQPPVGWKSPHKALSIIRWSIIGAFLNLNAIRNHCPKEHTKAGASLALSAIISLKTHQERPESNPIDNISGS